MSIPHIKRPSLTQEIAIGVGFKPSAVPQRFTIIYPPAFLSVTAVFCLGVQAVDKIDEAMTSLIIFTRSSEIQELYMFYFVLLYLIVLKGRIMQDKS